MVQTTDHAPGKLDPWDDWLNLLVGQKVVSATDDTLTLSDGTRLQFEKEAFDCCSGIELKKLETVDHVITAAELRDTEDETDGEGGYDAWVYVITEAGEFQLAHAEGDASNGYYLHGFALDVKVIPPGAQI